MDLNDRFYIGFELFVFYVKIVIFIGKRCEVKFVFGDYGYVWIFVYNFYYDDLRLLGYKLMERFVILIDL